MSEARKKKPAKRVKRTPDRKVLTVKISPEIHGGAITFPVTTDDDWMAAFNEIRTHLKGGSNVTLEPIKLTQRELNKMPEHEGW